MTLSKQAKKSRDARARIFHAARNILKKEGYDKLSIKNICEEAGVSNGCFYHHFSSKDDLLSYYIEALPHLDPDVTELPGTTDDVIAAIIAVYLNYAGYCRDLGVDFIASYYTPKNQSLNPLIWSERPYPITTVRHYLEKCLSAGVIRIGFDLDLLTTDIRMLVIGNVFEWAMKNGTCDFEGNIERSLREYLNSALKK